MLVVFGYVTGGLEAAKALSADSIFLTLRTWVYLFHMPAFFLLSGLFAGKAVGRPWRALFQNKTRTLVYPYILWTGIYLASQILLVRYVNNPPNIGRALHLLWEPYGYGLWFLYSLFLISMMFHLLLVAGVRKQILLLTAVAFHLGAWFNAFAFWPILNTAMLNLIFFAVGSIYVEKISASLPSVNRMKLIAAGMVLLGLMTIIFAMPNYAKLPLGLTTALLGIVGIIALSHGLIGLAVGRFFSVLGFYSLEIYLGHPLCSTAARAVWSRIGISSEFLMVLFIVSAGVFVSLAIALLCQKLQFPYLFRWPQFHLKPSIERESDLCTK